MKNYALCSREESKKFVTGYTIKDKKIFVEMANNVRHTLRFTKAEENNVKSRMVDQINIGVRDREKIVQRGKTYGVIALATLLTGIGTAVAGGVLFLSGNIELFKILIMSAVAIEVSSVTFGIKKAEVGATLADLAKSIFEQEHEDEINKNLNTSRSNMIGLDRSTIKRIDEAFNKDKEPIDINTVANYTLDELQTIVENGEKNAEYQGRVKKYVPGGKSYGKN